MVEASNTPPTAWSEIYPHAAYTELQRVRANVATAVQSHVKVHGWSEADSAQRLGLTVSQIQELTEGRLSSFSLEALIRAGATAGLKVHVYVEVG